MVYDAMIDCLLILGFIGLVILLSPITLIKWYVG